MLESSDLVAFTAAVDLHRARAFYAATLGLPVLGQDDFGCVLGAHGIKLRVTAVPVVVRAGYTVLGWKVADIEAEIRDLTARGAAFLRCDGSTPRRSRRLDDSHWGERGLVRRSRRQHAVAD